MKDYERGCRIFPFSIYVFIHNVHSSALGIYTHNFRGKILKIHPSGKLMNIIEIRKTFLRTRKARDRTNCVFLVFLSFFDVISVNSFAIVYTHNTERVSFP